MSAPGVLQTGAARSDEGADRVYRSDGTNADLCRRAALEQGAPILHPGADGTQLARDKEMRKIDGKRYVLEQPLQGDVALLKAQRADRWGNLTYRKSARNFNPVMAMAAELSVVQVKEMVELGAIDPECVHTPGIFIDRIVVV